MLFNRYVSLRIKNLQTGVVTTIPNDFRIEFDYTKQLDEAKSSSTGSIKIYGLTQQTVLQFGQLYSTVELVCGYLQNDGVAPQTLFVGQATEISFKHDNPLSETSIAVSNRFADLNMGKKLVKSFATETLLLSIINDIVSTPNPTDGLIPTQVSKGNFAIAFGFPNLTAEQLTYLETYKFPYGYALSGTIKEVLDELCYIVGLTWRITDQGETIIFGFTENQEQKISRDSGVPVKYDSTTTSLVLTPDSGLIGLPYIKSDVVSENYGTGHDSDVVTLNREQKYKKDGTVVTKAPKKIRVRRYTVACKALIDPSIQPNSIIRLESSIIGTSGLFRVRDVKFTGDNMGDAWFMELELSGEHIL
jgi:hypothetical protein